MLSDSQVTDLQLCYDGHTFTDTMRILDIGVYDAILGKDWLDQCGPMICHWFQKTLEFTHNGEQVTLKGLDIPVQEQLSEVFVASLQQFLAAHEFWAMAVVDKTRQTPITVLPPDLQAILAEFYEVFTKPSTLPPRRALDHAITLQASAQPVNSRPFRYSPLQKDEIEWQVPEMIHADVVTPSMIPFGSPVLLVKKKDSSWQFCIDYRKLNTLTIKKNISLLIVDELLDELAGMKFFSKLAHGLSVPRNRNLCIKGCRAQAV
jgi:hypothetical protein